jgi:hypothetical protein
VTDIRRKFRSDAPHALRTQAVNYRAQLGEIPSSFPETKIDLRPSTRSRLSPDYEAGNVYAKFYDTRKLPSDEDLFADLQNILGLYERLRVRENLPIGTGTPISELKGQRVSLDPAHDFAVLCANCHRMIHRFEHPEDIEAFRKTLSRQLQPFKLT